MMIDIMKRNYLLVTYFKNYITVRTYNSMIYFEFSSFKEFQLLCKAFCKLGFVWWGEPTPMNNIFLQGHIFRECSIKKNYNNIGFICIFVEELAEGVRSEVSYTDIYIDERRYKRRKGVPFKKSMGILKEICKELK